jgi:DNA-binding NtrC family response regulator
MEKPAILCVDDEKIVLDNLRQQLQSSFGDRFEYEVAESVEEAWEVIEWLAEDGCEFVLVISDWLMPMTKGDEFLVEVHNKFPATVKIMLTGQADPDAVQNAIDNADLYAYVKKPWSEKDLIAKIEQALKQLGYDV